MQCEVYGSTASLLLYLESGSIFERYCQIFSSEEFKKLQAKGARAQRALWGSTSTKNPEYSDIKYVTELIGRDTVNTVPDKTLEAFLDHGVAEEALSPDAGESHSIITTLAGFA